MWQHLTDILQQTHNWLLIGLILILGHAGGKIAKLIRLPSVVGYLVVGVIFGASFLDLMNLDTVNELTLVSEFGLGIVAFLIGTELSKNLFKRMGPKLFVIILAESFGAFALVFLLVLFYGKITFHTGAMAITVGLVFAAMAPASAPAGTVAVIHEYKAKGPMTSLLLAVVGLDDGLAIMIYAFSIAGAKIILGGGHASFASLVTGPLFEIIGGLAVGGIIGLGLTFASSRTRSRSELLTLSVGAILLATGLANVLHLSLILANLAVGMVVVNLSKHEAERTYSSIKQITHPVYILFFVLAGAHLDLHILKNLSLLAPIYIIARSTGLVGGAFLGATVSRAEEKVRKYLGLGILSQAGVAIGLALMVNRQLGGPDSLFGDQGRLIAAYTINTIAATTIFFEIIGPVMTKIALSKAGEIKITKHVRGAPQ